MSQKISVAAGNSNFNEFDTLIPSIGDTADIVEAFRLYHYGKAGYTTGGNPASESIYQHLKNLKNDIQELQDAPTSGKVANEVPHDLDAGAVKVEIPNGFIWVDGNAVGDFNISQGTVTYTNNQPSTYSHGLIWVDKDEPITDPFNLNNFLTQQAVELVYLRKSNASATYATKVEAATKDIEVVSVDSTTYPVTAGEIYGLLVVSASVATSIVIPPDSSINFNIGSSFSVLRTGTANVTISPATGVTVSGTPGTRLRTQYSFATCLKIAANTWVVIGDTAVA